MILVNRNFGNYALSQAIGDMFKGSSDEGYVGNCFHSNTLATGSSLVSYTPDLLNTGNNHQLVDEYYNLVQQILSLVKSSPKNFFLVTEHFIKTLDKVYTKIWNESFTETGIYSPANLITLYNGFVTETGLESDSLTPLITGTKLAADKNLMLFKKFVDRCITAGILLEEDRLQYEDQISLNNFNRADLSTQIDLDNKLITFTASKPIDIKPDLNAMAQQYLEGKKLYLLMTPYLTNEYIFKNITFHNPLDMREPIRSTYGSYDWYSNYSRITPVKQPIAFFKPKTDASKFGRSLPLATHLIWSLGTPADKEIALIEGTPVPDLVFDHLDRISHIDSLVLKIKFDKLQF